MGNENIYGDYSNAFYGKTKYPSQVKNLKQNSSYRTLIKLSWDKASYASGYRVYRSSSKDGTYKRVAELVEVLILNLLIKMYHQEKHTIIKLEPTEKLEVVGTMVHTLQN